MGKGHRFVAKPEPVKTFWTASTSGTRYHEFEYFAPSPLSNYPPPRPLRLTLILTASTTPFLLIKN